MSVSCLSNGGWEVRCRFEAEDGRQVEGVMAIPAIAPWRAARN
jgi:hypothetical protein